MQTAILNKFDSALGSSPTAPRCNQKKPRRWISPESGRALEILGHAIEYLADEYALNAARLGWIDGGDPQVEAIHILMAANREVYYSCPQIEPLWRRIVHRAQGRSQENLRQPGRILA